MKVHEGKVATRSWPLATTLLLRTFKQMCVGGGGGKIHAKFSLNSVETDMHTQAHVLLLTCGGSHGTPCWLGLLWFRGAGPRQSQRLAKALFIVL